MAEGIRIDGLGLTVNPSLQHEFAAMKDGLTVKLSVQQVLDIIVAYLTGAAPVTLDTIVELAAALGDDPNFAATMAAALGNRLRIDASQGLNGTQKQQGRDNLGLGALALLNGPLGISVGGTDAANAAGARTNLGLAGSWFTLASVTINNQASVDITGIPAEAKVVEINCDNVAPGTDGQNLAIRTSTNGGSSYDGGASDYNFTQIRSTIGGSLVEAGNAATSEIVLTSAIGTAAGRQASGVIRLQNPGVSQRVAMTYQFWGVDSSGNQFTTIGGGRRNANADVDAVRVFFLSGNLNSGIVTARYFL